MSKNATLDNLLERVQATIDSANDGYLIGQWHPVASPNQENDIYLAGHGNKDSGFYLSEIFKALETLQRIIG